VRLAGVNLQVVNGAGSTESTNGLGNLIVGYDEYRGITGETVSFCSRHPLYPEVDQTTCEATGGTWYSYTYTEDNTGSHNLVIGKYNNYTSYGGLVVGFYNSIRGPYATVTAGRYNKAIGSHSSVSGGRNNLSGTQNSSVSGGQNNYATGNSSSISGGSRGYAAGSFSSVSGGSFVESTNNYSSVSGGLRNYARGDYSSVTGGFSLTESSAYGLANPFHP
jgi:hypothetical protein